MKKLLVTFLIIALLAAIGYIIMQEKGYNSDALMNIPQTIDLTVSCSEIGNFLVASETSVTVRNNSSRVHKNVTVRLTAYDKKGNIIKEKTTTFEMVLEANSSLSKPVGLPAKAKRCDCIIESSNPQ